MSIARFILNTGSDRLYSAGRRIARERVISRSRSYRQLVLCNKIKQKRSKELREIQISLRKRNLLPMSCQVTVWAKINAEQERLSKLGGCIFDEMNKPYQVALFEFENRLKESDLTSR